MSRSDPFFEIEGERIYLEFDVDWEGTNGTTDFCYDDGSTRCKCGIDPPDFEYIPEIDSDGYVECLECGEVYEVKYED